MPGVFISYRRDDSAGHAGALLSELHGRVGAEQVFMDIEDIEAGTAFPSVLREAVQTCDVLLALGVALTVSLNGTLFEVDAALVGQTVTLRYDPSVPASRGIEVWDDADLVERARVVDAYANCFVLRNRPTQGIAADTPAQAPCSGLALRDLRPKGPDDKESR